MRLGICPDCNKVGPITPVLNERGLCSTCWRNDNKNNPIKENINEDVTKTDIKKDIKTYMDSTEFKSKVERIVKDRLKNEKELEDRVVKITKNVITQLYKTLWTRRGMWQSQLKNAPN
jgi:hypothetical protein